MSSTLLEGLTRALVATRPVSSSTAKSVFFQQALRLCIGADAVAVAYYCSDVLLRPALFTKYLFGHRTVLVGIHLVIEVMDQSYHTPHLLILAMFAGHVSHDTLNGQSMFEEAVRLVVFFEEREGFFTGWSV